MTSIANGESGSSVRAKLNTTLGARANVMDFMSVRGVMDADATAAIQAAVNSLGNISGSNVYAGEVFFPPGTYNTTSAIKLEGDNNSFVLRGVGTASKVVGNFQDFIFRRADQNAGGANTLRQIVDLHIENNNTSAAAGISISSATNISFVMRFNLNAPHGVPIGDWRIFNVTGVSVSGYNGLIGLQADSATTLVQFNSIFGSLAAGSGGTLNITPGGGVCMLGADRALIANCFVRGFYGVFVYRSFFGTLFNLLVNIGGNPAGSVGIYFGGEGGVYSCDITGYDVGLQTPNGAPTGKVDGCRCENNNTGMFFEGPVGFDVSGCSFESNIVGLIAGAANSSSFRGFQFIGTAGVATDGLFISGTSSHSSFSNMKFSAGFSNHAVTGQAGSAVGQCVFTGIDTSDVSVPANFGGQWIACQAAGAVTNVGVSAFAGAPTYANEGDTWVFTDSTQTPGSITIIGGGGANRVAARYSSNKPGWLAVCYA